MLRERSHERELLERIVGVDDRGRFDGRLLSEPVLDGSVLGQAPGPDELGHPLRR